jgi:tape measure domain-containing protein
VADSVLRFNFLVGKNEVPAAADKNAGALTKLASRTASFGKVAAVALGGAAVAAGGMTAAGVVMGVKTAASLEQAQIGFTTLLGSSRKAGDYLTKLKAFAAATPFELTGLIESSRSLLGVGVNANDAMKILKSFGDTASAVGIDQAAFQRIMVATSQAIGAGKFQTADLNQIMNNGIPIWTILSKAMGKPIPVLRDMASKGKLLASDVLPLLEKQMGKDYGGAMARQSQTLSGLWSTLMDTLNLGLAGVIQPLMPALRTLATKGIEFLGSAFAKLPGLITAGMTGLGRAKDWIVTNLLPGIRAGVTTVRDHLPRIDLGALFGGAQGIGARVAAVLLPAGGAILAAAQTWGGRILTGITTGLHAGNWGPLGKTLADGLVASLTTLTSQGARLVRAFTGWFGSIDWLNVGKTVGAQAIPFGIGFVNSLLDGLFTAVRQHPMDVLLFAAAFIPLGKFAAAFGPLRSAIEHLPLGSWFTSLLDHTAVPVFNAVKGFLGFIFRGFRDGFTSWFPGISKTVGGFFRGIVDDIALRALYAVAAAKNFVYGLAHGVGVATGGVVRAIGTLIADIVRPFARAGGWLVGKGVDVVVGLTRGALSILGRVGSTAGSVISRLLSPFARAAGWLLGKGADVVAGLTRGVLGMLRRVAETAGSVISRLLSPFARAGGWLIGRGSSAIGGLVSGIRGMLGRVTGSISSVISRVTSPFRRAWNFLFNAGYNVIAGFLGGLRAMWGKVTGWVSGIASWIRNHKGPISLDAKLLIPAGMAIMTGFYNGLKSGAGKAWSFVKSVGGKTVAQLQSALGMGGMMGGMPVQGGGNSSNKAIGQRMNAAMGWGGYWPALNNLWMGESGWNQYARNPSSGAYGIPQSLPASKMASAGSDWMTNPATQIRWGLGYIAAAYGNPGRAYSAWLSRSPHWYEAGTRAARRGLAVVGERGPELVSLRGGERIYNAQQTSQLLARGGAGGDVHVHLNAPNYLGSRDELVREFYALARQGRLRQVITMATR